MTATALLLTIADSLGDRGRAWATFFGAMVLQSLPFLVLGVAVSAVIHVLLPARVLRALLDRRPAVSIPLAAACGVGLPGCECSAVPVAGRLAGKGVPFSAAMAFALASPAINPVVLASTATAFPGEPRMVVARFVASFVAVVLIGGVLYRAGIVPPPMPRYHHDDGPVVHRLFGAAQHDLLHTGGYLVVGAILVASLKVVVPGTWTDSLGEQLAIAIPAAMLLAILLSICSEADAFVAASLTGFPLTARLAFMVVGPLVDIRLITLYRASFGGRTAALIAGSGVVAAALTATTVGGVLL